MQPRIHPNNFQAEGRLTYSESNPTTSEIILKLVPCFLQQSRGKSRRLHRRLNSFEMQQQYKDYLYS